MSGTINLARNIFSHVMFPPEPFTKREAWVWLIMEASWKARTVRAGGFIVDLQRGQLAASVRFMAQAWQWTPAKAQRYLKSLENMKMIRSGTDTGVMVVTICNYDKYQSGGQAADTGPIQDRYRTDTNEKKDERKMQEGCKDSLSLDQPELPISQPDGLPPAPEPSKRKRAVALPEGWVPSEKNIADAIARNFTAEEIQDEAVRFRDYHLAKGTTFKDWDAGWRTWLGNARKFAANRPMARGSQHGSGKPVGGLVGAFLRSEASGRY